MMANHLFGGSTSQSRVLSLVGVLCGEGKGNPARSLNLPIQKLNQTQTQDDFIRTTFSFHT